ncbi:hypothetical protein SynNOUM97013_01078 [Synechococcus sp. NOUM97013]|nr:hypothetical protein SynNOUM97013_01078 [Synechococcus sp. NOUM97013]
MLFRVCGRWLVELHSSHHSVQSLCISVEQIIVLDIAGQ